MTEGAKIAKEAILSELDRPTTLIESVADRPGHDRRYGVDAARARQELDWAPKVDFTQGLRECVDWYRASGDWVRTVTA